MKGKPKKKSAKWTAPTKHTPEHLEELKHEELSGHEDKESLAASSTDEDEDEGLGDGNMGRSDTDILGK